VAHIIGYKEIPLESLRIGKAQVRKKDTAQGISELADNIAKVGLLHPIVVCPGDQPGTYEILLGQRRFLAYVELKKKAITCGVFDEKVDPLQAKILSLSENLARRGLSRIDLIDVCTELFKKYGTVRAVAEASGLPVGEVSSYVKYDRLIPELKELVDRYEVDLKAALRAQDAASVKGKPDPQEAVKFARELAGMSGANQERVVRQRRENPEVSADEIIESAKSGDKITEIVVKLGQNVHQVLQAYARDEGTTQDDAAAGLITEALVSKGYLEE
jgi:ParB family chromosome partitioning protein